MGTLAREVNMTRFQTLPARPVLTLLCLSLGPSQSAAGPALGPGDRSAASSPTTREPRVPGATVTVRNEATGVETVLVTNSAGAYTTAPLVLGPYSVTVNLTRVQEGRGHGDRAPRRRRASATTSCSQVGDLTESVEVTGGGRARRHPARRQPQRGREVLQGPPDRHRRRRPPGRVGAPDAARATFP